jgi:hypothetical protein
MAVGFQPGGSGRERLCWSQSERYHQVDNVCATGTDGW